MPAPVICVVGKTNSGKTTFIEKLIAELTARKFRVATVKHVAPEVEMDKPGKDSYRHVAAGSLATVVASSKKLALIKAEEPGNILDASLCLIGEDYDIV
ncbi:MAG: molybdopterin-guanine dinucleotide biosynthesis protein B, partial [Chloroflexi bacterium]|nr:molybdopterin-guanine dinucleotide biosynthesis protein B [Chloroflexota bacterium]